jgi:hypothetical protein
MTSATGLAFAFTPCTWSERWRRPAWAAAPPPYLCQRHRARAGRHTGPGNTRVWQVARPDVSRFLRAGNAEAMRTRLAAAGRDGRDWDRTSDLPRVKRALSR